MSRGRQLLGCSVSLGAAVLLSGVMLPVRDHLDHAVVALVLVVPVVLGAVVGGFRSGLVAAFFGFLAYDLAFIRPYWSLDVSRRQSWAVLLVYVVVMALVSRLVDQLWSKESAIRASQQDTATLFQMSELLVGDRPADELFSLVVSSVRRSFELDAVALLLPRADDKGRSAPLRVVSTDGRELGADELAVMTPTGGTTWSLKTVRPTSDGGPRRAADWIETVVLTVQNRPIGLLGIVGPRLSQQRRELLSAFSNQVALAIERSALREQAMKIQLLEEIDRQRRYLFGAVSHDLRTPLSTIKAAASALLESTMRLSEADRAELAGLIESQSDRLARVVSNLLDMSRIQAGTLVVQHEQLNVADLFDDVAEALGPGRADVVLLLADEVPMVVGDAALLVEALVNVAENALRFSPEGTPVELRAERGPTDTTVRVTVTDRGPGFSIEQKAAFEADAVADSRPGSGSRLGLAIARAFVEAHGGTIRIEDAAPGARVVVELPAAPRHERAHVEATAR